MKQVRLKLLLCLLLATSITGQGVIAGQTGQAFGAQPLGFGQSQFSMWGGLSPPGAFQQQPTAAQIASGFGQQFGMGSQFGAGFQQAAQPAVSQPSSTDARSTGSDVTSGTNQYDGSYAPVPADGDSRTLNKNTCFNIIDSAFPSFSHYCSVLPQTTFSLPNFFGHTSKQQANALLLSIRPALESSCFEDIRMFVCPLFFPPCDTDVVLPCAGFCQAVKSRCNAFDLTTLDCSQLPEKSDFCPSIVQSSRLIGGATVQDRSASFSDISSQTRFADDYPSTSALTRSSSSYGAVDRSAPSSSYSSDRNIVDSGYGSAIKIAPLTLHDASRNLDGSAYGSSIKSVSTSSYGADRNLGGSGFGTSVKSVSSSYGADRNLGGSGYGGAVKVAPTTSYGGSSYTSNVKSAESSYGNGGGYGASYSTQTYGEPFGIQSTGEYANYRPETLDLSRCGPTPAENPCTIGGPQFYPIAGSPNCYIQCSLDRMFVKPCPYTLVWNTRVNACDWPTVAQYPAADNTNYGSSYSYGRKKRSTAERKKRNLPGLFSDPIVAEVPMGPPVPGLVPLPGFAGPIGIPGPLIPPPFFGPPFLPPIIPPIPPPIVPPFVPPIAPLPPPIFPPFFPPILPPVGPLVPPIAPIPPPILPPVGPLVPPIAPIPPPILPPPLLPPFLPPIVPPLPIPLGGPLLPPLPMSIPATFIPGPPPIFGAPFFGPGLGPFGPGLGPFGPGLGPFGPGLGPFGPGFGPFGPLEPFGGPFFPFAEPFFDDPFDVDFGFGGGFPFGDEFYGGFPGPFFEPFPFPAGYDAYGDDGDKGGYKKGNGNSYKNKGGYGKSSYGKDGYGKSYSDDSYSKSKYKMNGNYKNNNYKGSKGYSSNKNSYSSNYNSDYYRRKRGYDLNVDQDSNLLVQSQERLLPQQLRLLSMNSYQQQQPRLLPAPIRESSPCLGQPPKSNLPHPSDSSKYISCIDDKTYEIMECPSGLIYNVAFDQCEKVKNPQALCESEKPCLNGGQCYQTSPTTFKCTCRGPWTGERCETPLSSCASNPCGEGNECHALLASDYKQDYVCLCDGRKSYGLTCERNTVPNPCLAAEQEHEQYYPFAYSAHAYVQCNGDLFYVRPCASDLYWNQESKICDRDETSPARPIEDQPSSYQINYGSQKPQVKYTRPAVSIADQSVDKQQGYRYHNYNPYKMVNDQSSYGQTYNQVNTRTEIPKMHRLFSLPLMREYNRRLHKPQSIISDQQTTTFVQQPKTHFMQSSSYGR